MINACIILYKCKLSESKTYDSLINNSKLLFNKIYIYSNSEKLIDLDIIPDNVIIIENNINLNIEPNYRQFFKSSKLDGVQYVCMLDQDTEITKSYIDELNELLLGKDKYSAIYPQIISNGNQVSPCNLVNFSASSPISNSGLVKAPFIGINSCCVINISDITPESLLDNDFPLDYLDFVISHKLFLNNANVYVLESRINHDLSVSSGSKIGEKRTISIIKSELKFVRKYGNNKAFCILLAKNIIRVIYSFFNKNYKYSTRNLIKSYFK